MKKIHVIYATTLGALLVVGSISILLYLYLTSPNVITSGENGENRWGGPAEFGQFGDMIGGIINPIFGALTTTLLLITYLTTHRDSLRESRKADREEIKAMINEFEKQLDQQKNENLSLGNFFLDRSLKEIYSNQKANIQTLEKLKTISKHVIEGNRNRTTTILYERLGYEKTFKLLQDMRTNIGVIADLHMELLSESASKVVNKYIFIKLQEFLATQNYHGLMTNEEVDGHLDCAEKKVGKMTSRRTFRKQQSATGTKKTDNSPQD